MGPALEAWGIELKQGFSPENLEPRPDLVVIGNVCRPNNPEARAAIDGGLPSASMAHALAQLQNVVRGEHARQRRREAGEEEDRARPHADRRDVAL
jgi:UDP-N-acetylmuramate-alanine ligase